MGPKTERSATGLETEVRNCKQSSVKGAQHPRWVVWMNKVRKIRWHGVMTETLKTQANNFVWDPGFN